MYQVFNVLTNEAMPVLSEIPYELAGPLAERRYEQKKDEQGNLLWLDLECNETISETAIEVIPGEPEQIIEHTYQPVMIDAGPLYEWREIIPTPADIAQQTAAALESAVDAYMDGKAQAKGFSDRHSFALRAGIPGSSWHAQALVFGAWMDAVNDYCWQVKLDCLAGTRTVPTVEELLAELPKLEGE